MKRHLCQAGTPFTFTDDNMKKAQAAIAQYPAGRQASAVKSLLDLAQRQMGGWVSQEAVEEVARLLDMPFIRVYEVVSFYTLFNLAPTGRVHVEVCTTTPCWLRGADSLLTLCQKRAEQAPSGDLSVTEVECLGACVNAPLVKIKDDYFEDLEDAALEQILNEALEGRPLRAGPYANRTHSAPLGYTPKKGAKA